MGGGRGAGRGARGRRRLGYAAGHALNDGCSAVWFTYALSYLVAVAGVGQREAGAPPGAAAQSQHPKDHSDSVRTAHRRPRTAASLGLAPIPMLLEAARHHTSTRSFSIPAHPCTGRSVSACERIRIDSALAAPHPVLSLYLWFTNILHLVPPH